MHWAICSLPFIDLYALPFIIRYSSTLATVPKGEPSALNLTADKINGSNIMTHYNLESGTIICTESTLHKTRSLFITRL